MKHIFLRLTLAVIFFSCVATLADAQTIRTRAYLDTRFETGDFPTATDYKDWRASFWHVTEDTIPVTNLVGVDELSNDVALADSSSRALVTEAAVKAYVDAVGAGSSLTDGDKGAIVVSGGATVWNIDTDAVGSAEIATGAVGTSEIANSSVANTDLATMPANTIKGNNTAGAISPVDLTTAQVKTLLDVQTTDLSDFAEAVEDKIGTKVVAGGGITVAYDDGTGETTITGSGLADGDKGDIDVTSSGATWTLDTAAVTTVKIADDAVTLAKQASGTANRLQGFDASGNPSEISVSGIASLNAGNLAVTEVDGSTTNELQTIANTSDATSHTVTLSNSGGSVQLVEGSNITLTTTGTGSAGVVTIAATGGVSDGDKGDITVSGDGATFTIDAGTVNSSKILDGTIATADIADDAVTLAKMASGTALKMIHYDTAGNPAVTTKKYNNTDLYENAKMIGRRGHSVKYNYKDAGLNVLTAYNDTLAFRSVLIKSTGDDFWNLHEIGTVSPQYLVNADTVIGTHTAFGSASWASTNTEIHHDFRGTGFTFQHYGDNRGGIWRFYLEQNGAVLDSADVDTYSATPLSGPERVDTVFSGLTLGTYHIRAVNIPEWNPSSTGENRGWFSYYVTGAVTYEHNYTFNIFSAFDDPINHFSAVDNFLVGLSNKEFAFSVVPEGSVTAEWIPSHGYFSSKHTGDSLQVFVDGVEIAKNGAVPSLYGVAKKVMVRQTFDSFHPSQANKVADVETFHVFTPNNTDFQIDLTWRDTASVTGYGFMMPVNEVYGDTLITDQGQRLELDSEDDSEVVITEELGNVKSFQVKNNNNDILFAAKINDDNTLRESEFVGTDFLQHRSTLSVQKVYMRSYNSTTVYPGEKFRNSASMYFSARTHPEDLHTESVYNARTGFRINNAATSGDVLYGNGTNFVSTSLASVAVVPGGNTLAGALTIGTNDDNNFILERNNTAAVTIGSGGSLTANAYTSSSAFAGTTSHFVTQNSSGQLLTKSASTFRQELNLYGTGASFTVTSSTTQDTIKDLAGTTTSNIAAKFTRIDNMVTATLSYLVYTQAGVISATHTYDPPVGLASDFTASTDVSLVGGGVIQTEVFNTGYAGSRVMLVTPDTANDEIDAGIYYGNGTGAPAHPGNRYRVDVTFIYVIN